MTDELDPRRLQALLDEAAKLPRELPPERDAWPAIRARIEAQRVRPIGGGAAGASPPRRPSALRWLGAAAAIVVVGVTSLWFAAGRGKARETATVPPQGGPGNLVSAKALETSVTEYESAVRDLEGAVVAREAQLSPETRAVVRRSLATIDSAIADLRGALARDPRNPALSRYLTAVYQQKLDFLKRARTLTVRG